MAQKIIGNMWDRVSRNDINGNFTELYGKYADFAGAITEEIRQELLEGAEVSFIDPVETVADLPSDAVNGNTSFVMSTGGWYRYDGESWGSKPIAKTDPSEFISLRGDFDTLHKEVIDYGLATEQAIEDFQADVNNTIDDRLDDIQALVQLFINNIQEQVIYVEEEGENEHGYFIRWSDGKQEVWCNPISQVPNVRSGQIYRSEREEVTYPKPFLRGSMVSINARVSSFDRWAESNAGRSEPNFAPVYQYAYNEGSSSFLTHVAASGRWK